MASVDKEIKVYIYMTYANMLKVLIGRHLKVLSPRKCNDPYEFWPCGFKEQKKYYEDIGFLSFSSTCTSNPMWGHYGEKHKGVCLEFTFPYLHRHEYSDNKKGEQYGYHILKENMGEDCFVELVIPKDNKITHKTNGVLFDMRYREERAECNYGITGGTVNDETITCFVDETFITKDAAWNYEKEKRMIVPMNKPEKFISYLHKYLTRVILGARCSEKIEGVRKIIKAFCEDGDRKVKVCKIKYSKHTFDMEISRQ
ncbi:MAG: DUF2971 domain-containing protein [Akkermansiaceae bacterium]|nr:DUF2971 domain-containing protein [Akkermansiaceae bacterium]